MASVCTARLLLRAPWCLLLGSTGLLYISPPALPLQIRCLTPPVGPHCRPLFKVLFLTSFFGQTLFPSQSQVYLRFWPTWGEAGGGQSSVFSPPCCRARAAGNLPPPPLSTLLFCFPDSCSPYLMRPSVGSPCYLWWATSDERGEIACFCRAQPVTLHPGWRLFHGD